MKGIIYTVFGILFSIFTVPLFAEEPIEDVVIIGAGPAGLSAAIFAGENLLNPLIINSGPSQMQISSYTISNYPGFPDAIDSLQLYSRIKQQALASGVRYKEGYVQQVDLQKRPFQLELRSGEKVICKTLIIATGAHPRQLKLQSEAELKLKGVSYFYEVSDASKFKDKKVIILGGGDTGFSKALLLAPTAEKVTLVFLGDRPTADQRLQKKASQYKNITIIPNSTVEHVEGKTVMTGVSVENEKTQHTRSLPADALIIAIGIVPSSSIFKGQLSLDKHGYIITQAPSRQTSVPGVFAAGDVADFEYRKIITSASEGAKAGIDVQYFLKAH